MFVLLHEREYIQLGIEAAGLMKGLVLHEGRLNYEWLAFMTFATTPFEGFGGQLSRIFTTSAMNSEGLSNTYAVDRPKSPQMYQLSIGNGSSDRTEHVIEAALHIFYSDCTPSEVFVSHLTKQDFVALLKLGGRDIYKHFSKEVSHIVV